MVPLKQPTRMVNLPEILSSWGKTFTGPGPESPEVRGQLGLAAHILSALFPPFLPTATP